MADDEGFVIPNFSAEDLEGVREQLGLHPIDETEKPIPTVQPQPVKRRRGRPRKNPLPEPTEVEASTPEKLLEPAKLTKRDEREVAERLAKLLTGGTGLVSVATRPYMEMTEDEAKDIAEPLSSYLVRNADTIPVARQVLENYDLAAIVLGILAYVVRVYGERRSELATRPATPSRAPIRSVTQIQNEIDERGSVQGSDVEVGVENSGWVSSVGSIPGV